MRQEELQEKWKHIELKTGYKRQGEHNPVMTQRFGADPYALVYDGRVYLYMTGDTFIRNENGEITENVYSQIDTINVVSSEDLVNWTDHGTIYAAGKDGAAKWCKNAWAPAAVCKEMDGKMKFFLYFANGGDGIVALEADSPVGPFCDKIGKPLISRQTPTCAEVTWLFDPAVLVDNDGEAYIYFGGGVPNPDMAANPGTVRVARLGKDMLSIQGEPVAIADVPYLFEDSGINKINGKYYYSYCSNFSIPEEKAKALGYDRGEIMVMTGDNPMGPFVLEGSILKNPGWFFGLEGNNHHCMFYFHDQWYMAYHTRILEERMGILQQYRSTSIDVVQVDADGRIDRIQATREGVAQVKALDPYRTHKAATMASAGGLTTRQYGEQAVSCGSGDMIVTGISDGSWIQVCNADFGGKHVKALELSVRGTAGGYVRVCLDSPQGEEVCTAALVPGGRDVPATCTVPVDRQISGTHDLYFVFLGEGYELYEWRFVPAYRNVFVEFGKSPAQVEKRLGEIRDTFFFGKEDERVYYEAGDDMAYIMDTGNNDARTEGMSYGMMLCVQLDMHEEFDRIWKWAKTYMWMPDGENEGYFAWSCATDGTRNADGPAPDGEEFFAMALFFAAHRWGDGESIFNYSHEARELLRACLHKGENGRPGAPIWNRENHQILFVPGADFTDPSYHLPHFYELFALWAYEEDRAFWKQAALESRRYLAAACHAQTGFSAEYAEFDGSPMSRKLPWTDERHDWFYSDSYRTVANIGLDYEWFGKDEGQCRAAQAIQAFLLADCRENTFHIYEVDGRIAGDQALHPTAVAAATAASVLAADTDSSREWVERFWKLPMRTGKRRYYDNCLYFFAFLSLSGNYRIW